MLRQLKADVTQRCAFIEGSRPQLCLRRELVDCVIVHSCLQGNALFTTTRSKDSAQCIATAKDSCLQAANCVVWMHNLEVLHTLPWSGNLHLLAHAAPV